MRKYLAFVRASIQSVLTYRAPMGIWLVGDILTLITLVAVWLSTDATGSIGGYTKSELISYYVIALFFQWLTSWFPFYGVVQDIRDGKIVFDLTKPVSFFWTRFSSELGWHIISTLFGLLATLALIVFIKPVFVAGLSIVSLVLIVLTTILAIVVVFAFCLNLGLLAFWFTEVNALESFFWMGRFILGGRGIPISFIPGIFQTITRLLPFRYMYSFPLEIYFNKLTLLEIQQGILMQAIWILILVCLYRFLWSQGRRAYTSFGQ